jgi:hypothetical protein
MTRRQNGTFLPGFSPGKPRGVRNRLAHRIFTDALDHWCSPEVSNKDGKAKGAIALELLYRERPAEYCRLMASLLPRQFEHSAAELNLPDEELDELLVSLRRRMIEQRTIERCEATPVLTVVKKPEPVQ